MRDRQFERDGAKLDLILKQAQHSILHQIRGFGPGLGGELRKLRFLLRVKCTSIAFKVRIETRNIKCPVARTARPSLV
jgi:hypothetical protein